MLKFRAVYKGDLSLGNGKIEKGLLFYSKEIDSKLYFVMECDEECRYPFEIPFLDEDWIVMFDTGLVDKTGVALFVGDIIKFGYGQLAAISLVDGVFCAPAKSTYPLHAWFRHCSGVEVVGNIYENPELLEGKVDA